MKIKIVRPTRDELYERLLAFMDKLGPKTCEERFDSDWPEVEWIIRCLFGPKPSAAAPDAVAAEQRIQEATGDEGFEKWYFDAGYGQTGCKSTARAAWIARGKQ